MNSTYKFKQRNVTKEYLLSNGFRYNKNLSNDGIGVYTYRFPVYKYKNMIALDGELEVMLGNNNVNIGVYLHGTDNIYAPFYHNEYGNYDKILEEIWESISSTIKKMDIIRGSSNE